MTKPILGVSKCLEFDNCRYDGKMIGNDFVRKLKENVDFVPVCPEMGIGLGSPRPTIRLVKIKGMKNLYQPSTGENLTEKMHDFSNSFLDSLEALDGFILKHSSPTCGIRNVKLYHKVGDAVGYDATNGMFTELLLKKFPNLVVEDEARLRNPVLKNSFLTRVYAMASLRESLPSKDKLIDFCENNKMLFLCYDQTSPKKLSDFLKNYQDENFDKDFTSLVYDILNKIPDSDSLNRTFGYIFSLMSDKLAIPERDHFDSLLGDFNDGLILPGQVSALLYSWALRFDAQSIIFQTIFEPYPKKLIPVKSEKRTHSLLQL